MKKTTLNVVDSPEAMAHWVRHVNMGFHVKRSNRVKIVRALQNAKTPEGIKALRRVLSLGRNG